MRFSFALPLLALAKAVVAWGPEYVGALYTLDNNPNSQAIIVNAIDIWGGITFADLVYTSGKGPEAGATDLILGSDGVVVSGQYLFVVNTGSNSVSMFAIDEYDPTNIIHLGQNVWSGGDYPISISVSPDNTVACVLNAGQNNGAQFFSLSLDGMMPMENGWFPFGINGTTPPASFTSVPGDTMFTADGTQCVVTVKGSAMPGGFEGFVWDFAIENNGCNTTVSKVGSYVPAGATPLAFSLSRFPNSTEFFMTNPGNGGGNTFMFGSNGTLMESSNFTLPGAKAACWNEYSNVTESFFAADTASGALFQVSLDLMTTNVMQFNSTLNSSVGAELSDIAIAEYNSSCAFLYVLGNDDLTIRTVMLTNSGMPMVMEPFQLGMMANSTGQVSLADGLQGLAAYVKPMWARMY